MVVTGASRGIGREIAAGFARAGAKVVLAARGAEAVREAAAAIGSPAEAVALDVSDPASVERTVKGVLERHGTILSCSRREPALQDIFDRLEEGG